MNLMQTRFVDEYVIDGNATQAAIRAGYSEKSAYAQGHELLKHREVITAIEQKKAELAQIAQVNALWVLKQWVEIATANPNDLVKHIRTCCRFCWGIAHQYQWTEAGYLAEVNRCLRLKLEPPDGMGGFGFQINREPHSECPECGGRGLEQTVVADTRYLTGPAARLYGGVQRTKDGIKVIMRDQDGALLNIAKYLGMLVEKKELSGPGGGPLPLVNLKAEDLTDEQLLALIEAGSNGHADNSAGG